MCPICIKVPIIPSKNSGKAFNPNLIEFSILVTLFPCLFTWHYPIPKTIFIYDPKFISHNNTKNSIKGIFLWIGVPRKVLTNSIVKSFAQGKSCFADFLPPHEHCSLKYAFFTKIPLFTSFCSGSKLKMYCLSP